MRSITPLSELASRQHGRIAHRQVVELGWSGSGITRLRRRGLLIATQPRVYALAHAAPSRDADLMGAALAAGDGAMISHVAAAQLWGITRRRTRRIDVTGTGRRSAGRGIRMHARRDIEPHERSNVRGIPVSAPLRTLEDLATVVRADELRYAIHEALHLNLVDMGSLDQYVKSRRGRVGIAKLRSALHDYRNGDTGTRSGFESDVADYIAHHFSLAPRRNFDTPVEDGTVSSDMCWPELGICGEADGPVHDLPATKRKDRRRDRRLREARWLVFRINHRDFERDPASACRPLLDALRAAAHQRRI